MGRLKTGIPDDLMDMPASESNRNVLEDKSLSAISRELTRFVEIEKVSGNTILNGFHHGKLQQLQEIGHILLLKGFKLILSK